MNWSGFSGYWKEIVREHTKSLDFWDIKELIETVSYTIVLFTISVIALIVGYSIIFDEKNAYMLFACVVIGVLGLLLPLLLNLWKVNLARGIWLSLKKEE